MFLTYLEEGRDAFFVVAFGGEPDYVVARIEVDLRTEVRYPERRVTVRLEVERLGTTSLTTRETVLPAAGEVAAEARAVTVRWDRRARKPMPFTEAERASINAALDRVIRAAHRPAAITRPAALRGGAGPAGPPRPATPAQPPGREPPAHVGGVPVQELRAPRVGDHVHHLGQVDHDQPPLVDQQVVRGQVAVGQPFAGQDGQRRHELVPQAPPARLPRGGSRPAAVRPCRRARR